MMVLYFIGLFFLFIHSFTHMKHLTKCFCTEFLQCTVLECMVSIKEKSGLWVIKEKKCSQRQQSSPEHSQMFIMKYGGQRKA